VDSAGGYLGCAASKPTAKSSAVRRRLWRNAAKRSLKLASGGSGFEVARKALREWAAAAAFAAQDELANIQNLGQLADLLREERDLTRFAEWLEDHGFSRKLAPGLWRELKQTLLKTRREAAAAAIAAFS